MYHIVHSFAQLEPPLEPPRGEVNAADAFDIGSFDEDDTKKIRVRFDKLHQLQYKSNDQLNFTLLLYMLKHNSESATTIVYCFLKLVACTLMFHSLHTVGLCSPVVIFAPNCLVGSVLGVSLNSDSYI